MQNLLLVGLGGFLGSILRYASQQSLVKYFTVNAAFGTFFVNIIGSFIIGVIYSIAQKHNILTEEWRLFLAIGFCGGFTTFSSLSLDNYHFFNQSNYFELFSYLAASIILGLGATFLGIISFK